MAEDSTTPDPADGARQRKRQAPTIDLTATEVPDAATPDNAADATAGEAQADATQPEAETDPDTGAAGRNETSRTMPAIWLMFLSGLTGAAVMTAALSLLWLAGLVPSREAAPASAESASIGALNERVAKIESSIAKLPVSGNAGMAERLQAADNAMKSLGIAIAALNKRTDEIVANVADARARADATEKAILELRNSVQNLNVNTSAGLSPADVETVQKRLSALEQASRATTADRAVRFAFVAAALRDAAASGAPFAAELDEARSLGAHENVLAALAPFAATGIPQPAALAQELRALIPAILKASGTKPPPEGFLERLQANAGKLVRIRPLNAPTGDDASAVLARVEIEATHADIDSALADLGKLDAAARAPAQTWIAKAKARQTALGAARQLATETTRALGKR
jgi:hypothetical protein